MSITIRTISMMCLLFIVLFFVCGCKLYSWIVLENIEFLDTTHPGDLSKKMKEKYTVGDVIVHPRIVYTDGTQTTQELFVAFFSKTNTTMISIKSINVSIGNVDLGYGVQIAEAKPSDWEMYSVNAPFYVCSISGEPIIRPKVELKTTSVQVSMIVIAIDATGHVIKKNINAHFVPSKRSKRSGVSPRLKT